MPFLAVISRMNTAIANAPQSLAATVQPQWVAAIDALAPFVGHTPLLPLTAIFQHPKVKVYAKAEWCQLSGSVKARAAYNILKRAVYSGELFEGQRLIDATSGNTGLAYAAIAARLGVPLTLCIPENCSPERKLLLRAYGAELVLTSPFDGTDGAQAEAAERAATQPDTYFYLRQYDNPANWQAHYTGTGPEIVSQTQGLVTHFVAGLGTTGTLTGTGLYLREYNPDIRIVALQPDGPIHGMEGWKDLQTARVPTIYQPDVPHENRVVSTEDSYYMLKRLARQEGLLVSPSAAANVAGALQLAHELADSNQTAVVVTTLADTADKYGEVVRHLFA